MNKVILVGRLTADPELRQTQSGVSSCRFTVAVDRKFTDKNSGERQADFITCVAWRQTASFIGSYFRKGSKIALVGSLQTRTYDDNQGQKRYVTEVVVEEAEFADSANSGSRESAPVAQAPAPAPSSAPVPEAPKAPAAPIDVSIYEEKDDGNGELPFDM